MKLSGKIKIFVNYFLGPLIFLWVGFSIYRQITTHQSLPEDWENIKSSVYDKGAGYWIIMGLCMFLNWFIEATKWRLAVFQVQKVSYLTALKAILSGVAISVTTPNRIGEYVGRILYMNEGKRLKAISLTIISSTSQLIVTLCMGLLSLLILKHKIIESQMIASIWLEVILYGALFITIGVLILFFNISWVVKWIDRLPGFKKYAYLIETMETFHASLLFKMMSLSLLRYLIFIVQYYLLIQLYDVNISFVHTLWAVGVSFFIMAIIPTIALITDLGLRGQVSLKLLGLFSDNILGIGLLTVSIWFLNLIVPAVIGSILILAMKAIFKNKNNSEI